ncbi:head completion/stabilization protein [Klebsiella pneumoniae]|uniref:head completion/stabilization protein n=1 Tax=Klebsiella pneumoniae TaxID=573 RepID=UPI003F6C5B05
MTTLIIKKNDEPQPGGVVVIPPPASDEPVIKKARFSFPDIDPKRVREGMRLEQTVAPARLREAIKTGIAETNAELFLLAGTADCRGFYASRPTYRLPDLDGESVRVFYYLRAVTSMATATLYERYRGVDASAKGDKKADSIDTTVDELWRDMRWAVSRVQDKPRCIVSQI